jgi:hypothetical protein
MGITFALLLDHVAISQGLIMSSMLSKGQAFFVRGKQTLAKPLTLQRAGCLSISLSS